MTRATLLSRVAIFVSLLFLACSQEPLCPVPFSADISSTDPNFEAIDGNVQNSFTTCAPSSANIVVAGSSPASLSLGISAVGCPTSCVNRPYSCSEYISVSQTHYGTYECVMKAADMPGTEASCYFASSGQGTDYQEIYIRFYGTNTTQLHIGFFANGVAYPDEVVGVTFFTDADYHTYSFQYEKGLVVWYVDGVLLKRVTPSYPGQYQMPAQAGSFVVSFITGDGTEADAAALGTYDGTATSIWVQNLTYTPSPCTNSSSTDSSSSQAPPPVVTPPWEHPCSMTGPLSVFADSLSSSWTDVSKGQHSLVSNYPVHDGTYALSWTVEVGTSLGFRYAASADPIALDDYWALEMWVNGGTMGGQQVTVTLTSQGSDLGFVNLGDYTNSLGIPQNAWIRLQIPIADFKVQQSTTFDGFYFSPAYNAQFMGVISFDDLQLTHGQPCTAGSLLIFSDALNSTWKDWSSGSYDLQSASVVATGDYSVQLQLFDGDSVYFHTDDGFSSNEWIAIQFDMNNQVSSNPQLSIAVAQNNQPGASMELSSYYGGELPVNKWTTLIIPFTEFGVFPGTILDGIMWKADVSQYQGPVYLDNIKLVRLETLAGSDDSSFGTRLSTSSLLVVAALATLAALLC